jgi:hypothetical protein
MEGFRRLAESILTLATGHPHFNIWKTWQPLLQSHSGCTPQDHQRKGYKSILKGGLYKILGKNAVEVYEV